MLLTNTEAQNKQKQNKTCPKILYNKSIKILLSFLSDALNLLSLKARSKPLSSWRKTLDTWNVTWKLSVMSARYSKGLNVPDFIISFTPVRTALVKIGIIFLLKPLQLGPKITRVHRAEPQQTITTLELSCTMRQRVNSASDFPPANWR